MCMSAIYFAQANEDLYEISLYFGRFFYIPLNKSVVECRSWQGGSCDWRRDQSQCSIITQSVEMGPIWESVIFNVIAQCHWGTFSLQQASQNDGQTPHKTFQFSFSKICIYVSLLKKYITCMLQLFCCTYYIHKWVL